MSSFPVLLGPCWLSALFSFHGFQSLWKTASTSSFSPSSFIFQPPVIRLPWQAQHSAALPESAVPPESWTQTARFRLYLRFLSVALNVINQLLKPSSSLALMRSFSSWSPVSLVVPPVPFIFFFSLLTLSIISGPCLPFSWLPSQSLADDLPRITSSQVWRPSPSPASWSSILLGDVPGALGSAWPKQNSFSTPCWFKPFLALT